MSLSNSPQTYGAVARAFHWATALLILTTFPLGLYALNLPYETAEALAHKTWAFSLHKTLGVATFFVALARILWALSQPRPQPLHPERRLETFMAEFIHWALYISLVAVPLSGWVHHAAVDGFAPIWWPLGQNLPFIAKSEAIAALATAMHWLFTKILLVSLALHLLGVIKHVLFDRDQTLARMTYGAAGEVRSSAPHSAKAPILAALALYVAALGLAFALTKPVNAPIQASPAQNASTASESRGNWQVESGTLSFSLTQMGSQVTGQFANWSAEITFDETITADHSKNGEVSVLIDTSSLSLGAVTEQAKGKDFFDIATFASALFKAEIEPAHGNYIAIGTLTLRGVEMPVALPFTLAIDGDSAQMQGETELDRRDFGMGANYPDEGTVGFTVIVKVDLTAKRLK